MFCLYCLDSSVNGAVLQLVKVSRLHMGAYLCIASNGVPPSVSKRVMLVVHCEYPIILPLYSIAYIVPMALHALTRYRNYNSIHIPLIGFVHTRVCPKFCLRKFLKCRRNQLCTFR